MIVERLQPLIGTWKGHGKGNYPTIDAFEYSETLGFELDQTYPLIHYEQRTWLMPSDEPSHWESGFIRCPSDGVIEISNSQDSGRVEVLRGSLQPADPGADLKLVLDSVVLDHDPRLSVTRRIFTVSGARLDYRVFMATHTTPEPRLQLHLEASLERATPR